MSDTTKTDKAQQSDADKAQEAKDAKAYAEKVASDKAAAEKAAKEQKKADEQKLKDDADYAKAVEGTGGLLAPHLKKFRERRSEWQPTTPEDAAQQQKSDQAAVRKLVADLILQNGSGIMAGLTESEQASARALAIKLKA